MSQYKTNDSALHGRREGERGLKDFMSLFAKIDVNPGILASTLGTSEKKSFMNVKRALL